MTVEVMDLLYEKILKVPIEDYDTKFLIFLKDFTINAS